MSLLLYNTHLDGLKNMILLSDNVRINFSSEKKKKGQLKSFHHQKTLLISDFQPL